jgi:hypothetical protein
LIPTAKNFGVWTKYVLKSHSCIINSCISTCLSRLQTDPDSSGPSHHEACHRLAPSMAKEKPSRLHQHRHLSPMHHPRRVSSSASIQSGLAHPLPNAYMQSSPSFPPRQHALPPTLEIGQTTSPTGVLPYSNIYPVSYTGKCRSCIESSVHGLGLRDCSRSNKKKKGGGGGVGRIHTHSLV